MKLHNIHSREELIKKRAAETFHRKACSFYRYIHIENPQAFRNHLYLAWYPLGVLGRIYVSYEGINAQLCVPEYQWDHFADSLSLFPETQDMFINEALTEGDQAFLKLDIKVREKIVADGIDGNIFAQSHGGKHVSPIEFHHMLQEEDVIVVDTRNDYECEIGHFENALLPESETFRDVLPELKDKLQTQKDKKILMYCTGGIRCEKASAYFKNEGFENVFQLQGGIINYLRKTKQQGLASKFHGSNFVFDGRMAEPIDHEKLGTCITCQTPYDKHVDCANTRCHKLIVQCDTCATAYKGCCSQECANELETN
ncbi:MAG: rhodanese-related sulfurtransferase [Deltaproteobacteria bacterium]|nr:rhodanese-related sulfurtransferase [Deltaproteobacteria bacterium]